MPAALLDTDVFSYLCLIRGHKRFGWRTAYESFLHQVGIGANYAISSIGSQHLSGRQVDRRNQPRVQHSSGLHDLVLKSVTKIDLLTLSLS